MPILFFLVSSKKKKEKEKKTTAALHQMGGVVQALEVLSANALEKPKAKKALEKTARVHDARPRILKGKRKRKKKKGGGPPMIPGPMPAGEREKREKREKGGKGIGRTTLRLRWIAAMVPELGGKKKEKRGKARKEKDMGRNVEQDIKC